MGAGKPYSWEQAAAEAEKRQARVQRSGYVAKPADSRLSTPLSLEVEAALPEDLRPLYRRLVLEYSELAALHHGRAICSPKVIADLVQLGWRRELP